MKNFIISLLTVLLVFATSCNEMDQYPHNAVSSDNLTEEDAQLLLTGLYFYIQNKPTVNGYLTQDIVGGDLVRGGATGLKDPVLLVKDRLPLKAVSSADRGMDFILLSTK